MANANASKSSNGNGDSSSDKDSSSSRSSNGNGRTGNAGTKSAAKSAASKARKTPQRGNNSTGGRKIDGRRNNGGNNRSISMPEVPAWLGTVMSIVGVGVAVGAGLYATRRQWMPKSGDWRDNFSGAHADDETDYDNFDQTRNAGTSSMRDHPGDDWDDVDDMADASFPASDPPSFNPGTA